MGEIVWMGSDCVSWYEISSSCWKNEKQHTICIQWFHNHWAMANSKAGNQWRHNVDLNFIKCIAREISEEELIKKALEGHEVARQLWNIKDNKEL